MSAKECNECGSRIDSDGYCLEDDVTPWCPKCEECGGCAGCTGDC